MQLHRKVKIAILLLLPAIGHRLMVGQFKPLRPGLVVFLKLYSRVFFHFAVPGFLLIHL